MGSTARMGTSSRGEGRCPGRDGTKPAGPMINSPSPTTHSQKGSPLSSAKAHLRRGSVDEQLLKYSIIPTSLGAGFGGLVAGSLTGGVLAMIFGFMAVVVSVRMIIPSNAPNEIVREPNRFFIGNLTGLTGIISAMVGIGGGAMNVPLMSIMGIKMHQAIGTSASLGFVRNEKILPQDCH